MTIHATDQRAGTTDPEARTREAWGRYQRRLAGLEGAHYAALEPDAWAELQATLRGLAEDHAQAAAPAG